MRQDSKTATNTAELIQQTAQRPAQSTLKGSRGTHAPVMLLAQDWAVQATLGAPPATRLGTVPSVHIALQFEPAGTASQPSAGQVLLPAAGGSIEAEHPAAR